LSDAFLSLTPRDRRDALEVAAAASGRPANLLEKDVWVVCAIDAVFKSPHGSHLVFKGGTSLSKAYGVIDRFSEDVDLTYDIRQIIPELTGDSLAALPTTTSQASRWAKAIRQRLPEWIAGEIIPFLVAQLTDDLEIIASDNDTVEVRYDPLFEGTGYVAPLVRLEFGARATGEPCELKPISCDAAPHLPLLSFPTAEPRTLSIARTFWEKATAIHVYCRQGDLKSERFARHWYDLYRLDAAGVVDGALADRELARTVAAHKAVFFRNKADGVEISYEEAVSGALRLVPNGDALDGLRIDYDAMVEEGLFMETPPTFDALMKACRAIERLANEFG